jgi:hypothetical protein
MRKQFLGDASLIDLPMSTQFRSGDGGRHDARTDGATREALWTNGDSLQHRDEWRQRIRRTCSRLIHSAQRAMSSSTIFEKIKLYAASMTPSREPKWW